jgi:hypothetical protein
MCSCLFIEMNQTAHISLQILAISKSVETKSNRMRRNFLGAPRTVCLCVSPSGPSKHPLRRSVRRPVGASAPPVKGYLEMPPESRKHFFGGPRKKVGRPSGKRQRRGVLGQENKRFGR